MEAVKSAKERMKKYPLLLAECSKEATHYAKCVVAKSNVQKNDCEMEFSKLKACLVKAAARNNTKL